MFSLKNHGASSAIAIKRVHYRRNPRVVTREPTSPLPDLGFESFVFSAEGNHTAHLVVLQAAAEVYAFLALGATSSCVGQQAGQQAKGGTQCERANEDGESLQRDAFQVVQR